jgi:hypothetical protein
MKWLVKLEYNQYLVTQAYSKDYIAISCSGGGQSAKIPVVNGMLVSSNTLMAIFRGCPSSSGKQGPPADMPMLLWAMGGKPVG